MLKRKIEKQLMDWKSSPSRKPLIIKGCRQCGKTHSVLEFARKNYQSVVYLNFFKNPEYAQIFEGPLDIEHLRCKWEQPFPVQNSCHTRLSSF